MRDNPCEYLLRYLPAHVMHHCTRQRDYHRYRTKSRVGAYILVAIIVSST